MADALTSDPPTVMFSGPGQSMKAKNELTNGGATKLAIKVKVSHATINVSKPFFTIDPGAKATLNAKANFPNGAPDATATYAIAILYADAPADMTDQKTAWTAIKDFKTLKLSCEFQVGEAAPAAADAAPGEGCGGE